MRAESIVVFATQDRSQGYRGISAFVVPRDASGLQVNPQHGKMGMRASSTNEIVFQDTPVAADNLLGEEGRGFRYAMEILDSSRIVIAAQCVGIGQAALEEAVRYAQQRESFGRHIAQHQAIQFMLADMATEVHAARTTTMQAATLKDQGLPFVIEASMAKLIASEMCVNVTSKALQIHGGYGYFKEAAVGTAVPGCPGYHYLRGNLGGPAAAHRPASAGPVPGLGREEWNAKSGLRRPGNGNRSRLPETILPNITAAIERQAGKWKMDRGGRRRSVCH